MQSSLIGKVEKAKRYAHEKNRVSFSNFNASFEGEHDKYSVKFDHGKWSCSCHAFTQNGFCSHTMALERILEGMVTPDSPVPVV
ncbi:MAG: hypothetical protein HYX90_08400 [Chloroflexi bacterium]|nr:hypothetical protein [Chloroflexota bacterium]